MDLRKNKGETEMDYRFVIPHKLAILRNYQDHRNMEWCNKAEAVKKLFKYITKGADKATIVIDKGLNASNRTLHNRPAKRCRDDIQEYLDCQYLSVCEAIWRTLGFHPHQRKPAIQKLIIHLPRQHNITYKAEDDLRQILAREDIDRTMLTAWMEKNNESEEARQLTYSEFPTTFTWNNDNKVWAERKKGNTIGRIVYIHPPAGELYYLRILINKLRGPRSFNEILTLNGNKHPDFKSACYSRGLLDSDSEWHDAMDEAIQWTTPYQLRHLFVVLLIYCEVGNPLALWNRCWKSLGHDFQKLLLEEPELQQYTLLDIEKIMHQYDRSLTEFKYMPQLDLDVLKELGKGTVTQKYAMTIIKTQGNFFKTDLPASGNKIQNSIQLFPPCGRRGISNILEKD